jgi:class 3 adenylate cyclase
MPLYMDVHKLQGVSAKEVSDAHKKDVDVQQQYGVEYLTYWFNDAEGQVYCLVDAPSVNAAVAVHREAHGLLPDEIIEVEFRDVEGFLGKFSDVPAPVPAANSDGSPFDSALRVVLFTDLEDSTAITERVGDDRAVALLREHDAIIRAALEGHRGSEVKHTGDGIMASFASASSAVACAIDIQQGFAARGDDDPEWPFRIRIGLTAGEPVANNGDLYGTAVNLAARICDSAHPGHILVSDVVRQLCAGKAFQFTSAGEAALKGFDEPVALFEVSSD